MAKTKIIGFYGDLVKEKMKKLIIITVILMLSACANNQTKLSRSFSGSINVPIETSQHGTGSLYQKVYVSQYGVTLSTGTYFRNFLGLGESININIGN